MSASGPSGRLVYFFHGLVWACEIELKTLGIQKKSKSKNRFWLTLYFVLYLTASKCPETLDKVLFGRACNHNNGETCTYRCDHGYTPSAPDDTMTCDDGSWDVESPCDEIGIFSKQMQ